MVDRNGSPALRLRTVFISDVHLGFKGCSADLLLDFLHHVEMDYLFLVGDIVDVWSMKKTMFWPQAHNNVLRTILGKAKRGTKVIFVPGNHDEVFREFDGAVFGNLEIHREYVHEDANGRKMLVLHGDEFDSVVKFSPWLANVGRESLYQLGEAQVRPAALVPLGVPEAKSQESGAVHWQFRGCGRPGGEQTRCRHGGLRSYPQSGSARHQRRPVLQ